MFQINDADNSNNFENGVFSDDDENIDASTPAPTPTSSNAAKLFDRKCKCKFIIIITLCDYSRNIDLLIWNC